MFYSFLQFLFLTSIYPIARWVLPHIRDRDHAIIFHITSGIVYLVLLYGQRSLMAIIMSVIGYFILGFNPYFVFSYAYLFNMFCHFLQMIKPTSLRISNISMIIFLKVTATTFNLEDGRRKRITGKSVNARREKFALDQKPTFLEWFAYCFSPFGALASVFYEFKLFNAVLECGNNLDKVNERAKQKALVSFKSSIVFALIYYSCTKYFSLSFYSTEFFKSCGPISRIVLILILSFLFLFKNYFQWEATQAGYYQVGLTCNDIGSNEDCINPPIYTLIQAKSIAEWKNIFNHTMSVFWKNYFSERISEIGLGNRIEKLLGYTVKPFYKGLYGGFFCNQFQTMIISKAEKIFRVEKPRDLLSNSFTVFFMLLSLATIRGKSTWSFFYVNYLMYFIIWVIPLVIIFGYEYFIRKKAHQKID